MAEYSSEGLAEAMGGKLSWEDSAQSPADTRICTCHPDDRPEECQRKFATRECLQSALLGETQIAIVALKNRDRQPHEQKLLDYLMRVRQVIET